MTLDEELVVAVDRAAPRLKTTRSGFTRKALAKELERLKVAELGRKHREGYRKQPVRPGEFSVREGDRV